MPTYLQGLTIGLAYACERPSQKVLFLSLIHI